MLFLMFIFSYLAESWIWKAWRVHAAMTGLNPRQKSSIPMANYFIQNVLCKISLICTCNTSINLLLFTCTLAVLLLICINYIYYHYILFYFLYVYIYVYMIFIFPDVPNVFVHFRMVCSMNLRGANIASMTFMSYLLHAVENAVGIVLYCQIVFG